MVPYFLDGMITLPNENMSQPAEKIEAVLRSTKGILDVKWLDKHVRERAFELEEKFRKEGHSGTGGYYNAGVIKVLSRKFVCVVLNNNQFRHGTAPSLFWIPGGVVIGEEVTDAGRLREFIGTENIKVLRKNFVLYFDRIKKVRGQAPVFVIRGLPFPEIEDLNEIGDILSASPMSLLDLYFKERFGWNTKARDLGTILIGFNPA